MGRLMRYEDVIQDCRIDSALLASMQAVCIPIYSVRNDWLFGERPHFNAQDPSVVPFIGFMTRVSGVGTWLRESPFDDALEVEDTASVDDLIAQRQATPAGSWAWLERDRRVVVVSEDASDAHAICIARSDFATYFTESEVRASIAQTKECIASRMGGRERAAHAALFDYYCDNSAIDWRR